jgi:hypothetical protein
MGKQKIIEETIQILESIVERANIINGEPDRDLCLDIDLMLEDIRLIYRNYEALKKYCDAGHTMVEKDKVTPADSKPEASIPAEIQQIPSFFSDTETEEEDKSVTDQESSLSDKQDAESLKSNNTDAKPTVQPETDAPHHVHNQASVSPVKQPTAVHTSQPTAVHTSQPATHTNQSEKRSTDTVKGGNGKTVIDLFNQSQGRSIGDQFGKDDNSLHQRISSQKEDKSIGARLQQHPINNIKDAIGLNEKFLFINELFEGDIQVYNENIAKLNNMGTLKEAFDYLNELTNIHHWDAKRSAETIEKLAGFVQRRYLDR